jgi:type II secretory pathway pseudopilin PulG
MKAARGCGFTLIEVLIATGLLVVMVLGVAQLFALALQQNMLARQQLVMGVLAAQKVDDLTAASAAGPLQTSTPDALDRSAAGFADRVSQSGATYVRRWLVAVVPDRADVVAIVVRVMRDERHPTPGPGTVEIATLCGVTS